MSIEYIYIGVLVVFALFACFHILDLKSEVKDLLEVRDDYSGKIQYLVDNWKGNLEDGGITFPDGDFWPQEKR